MQKHVKKQGSVCKIVQKFKLGMQNRVKIRLRYAKTCKNQRDGMQKRGTIRRDRRPRLSVLVGRKTTALSRYRPVGRGLASRREAIHTAMHQRGTIRRDRRPRLSEPVGRNITALLRYRPVGRGLASRRKATPTTRHQTRHNPYGVTLRPAAQLMQGQGI